MIIKKVKQSKLDNFDPNSTQFGNAFTDHMLICYYKNGKWEEPQILPYGKIELSPAIMGVHYGQAIFEGMKAYKSEDGDVYLFRPDMNFERFNKSALRLAMPQVPSEIFLDGMKTLIDLDRDWVPSDIGKSLYIRPVMFAIEEMLLARISNEYLFAIICSFANNYYSNPLRVKVADYYTRACKGGVGSAKAAGNYAASFYPTQLAREEGYDQIIWTDGYSHKYFEESGTMNIFVRINDTLFTPPLSDTILNGVTRNSLIHLARYQGIEVKEEKISVNWVYSCIKDGSLKEIFGCGTAVIVNRFVEIGIKGERIKLPAISDEESYASKLKTDLLAIQNGLVEDPFGWRVLVERQLEKV